tara:strand:- start:606 stop:1109 length:504 start_codon:yes stop_codon:yes gene_type:complete
MSSSFFDTSSYLKSEKNNAPFSLGTNEPLFNYSEFMKKSEEKSDKIEDKKEEKGKSFLGHYKDYLQATKENKSDADKDRDLLRELANKNNLSTTFGKPTSGFATEVAQGLNMFQPTVNAQQMFIPSQDPKGKSVGQRLAGAVSGLGKGLLTGVPHGGAFGAVSGFFA